MKNFEPMAAVSEEIKVQTYEFEHLHQWLRANNMWDHDEDEINWQLRYHDNEKIGEINHYRQIMLDFLNGGERNYDDIREWIENLENVVTVIKWAFESTSLGDIPEEIMEGYFETMRATPSTIKYGVAPVGPVEPKQGGGMLILVAVLAVLAFLMLT